MLFLCICVTSTSTDSYAAKPRRAASVTGNKPVKVTSIKYISNPNYTRVMIYLSGTASFKHHRLKEDHAIKKPGRLYIDIDNAVISPNLKEPIPINDDFLQMARAGQYSKDSVRVVLDIKSIKDYKVFPFEEPFRIVIDVTGEPEHVQPEKAEAKEGKPQHQKAPTLAQQLGLKIKRIVIDAGHGGHDPGAIGKKGLKEKDVVLRIASGLKEELSKETGAEIVMTRDDDTFIPLEERTAIANAKEADIFVSVHANASFNRKASGVETYFLNLTNDAVAMRVAARENAVSTRKMSDLQYILNDLMKTAKTNESSRLAAVVQETLVSTLRAKYDDVKGNGVKGAPFYVLVGTHMPSILVEVSFISNPKEEIRLNDEAYIKEVVAGISNGVKKYVEDTQ